MATISGPLRALVPDSGITLGGVVVMYGVFSILLDAIDALESSQECIAYLRGYIYGSDVTHLPGAPSPLMAVEVQNEAILTRIREAISECPVR